MALDTALYLVTKDIATRSGLIDSRYRIADGRFVLDNKDLSRVRFTTDEYINGLQGVEKVDDATAKTLIAQNGYQMGLKEVQFVTEQQEEEVPVGQEQEQEQETVETPEEENETTDSDDSDDTETAVDEEEQQEENENNEQETEEE